MIQKNRGFTLVEMLIVIVMIGILSAALIPRVLGIQARARDTARTADMRTIATTLEVYKIDHGSYPVATFAIGYPSPSLLSLWVARVRAANAGSSLDNISLLLPYITSIPKDPNGQGIQASTSGDCLIQGDNYAYYTDSIGSLYAVTTIKESKKGNASSCNSLIDRSRNGSYEKIGKGLTNILTENIIQTGLILYIDAGNTTSYPGIGTTIYDLTNNGYDGTLINGVSYDANNGGSLIFDGINDGLSLTKLIPNNASYTVELLFSAASYKYNAFTIGPIDFKFRISGEKPRWNFWTTSGLPNSTMYTTIPSLNTPTLYVASYGNNVRKIGMNGVYVLSSNGGIIPKITSSGVIGSPSFEPIHGKLYYIRVYDRVLSPEEILQNYNASKSRYGG